MTNAIITMIVLTTNWVDSGDILSRAGGVISFSIQVPIVCTQRWALVSENCWTNPVDKRLVPRTTIASNFVMKLTVPDMPPPLPTMPSRGGHLISTNTP